MNDESELDFEKQAYFVECKSHFQTNLKSKIARANGNTKVIREDLGSALAAIMKKEDLFGRLLATPLTPESAYNGNIDDSASAQVYGDGRALKTQEELEEE